MCGGFSSFKPFNTDLAKMPPPLVSANRTYLVIVDIFLYIFVVVWFEGATMSACLSVNSRFNHKRYLNQGVCCVHTQTSEQKILNCPFRHFVVISLLQKPIIYSNVFKWTYKSCPRYSYKYIYSQTHRCNTIQCNSIYSILYYIIYYNT